jgi:predicted nucleic acid-binding protein
VILLDTNVLLELAKPRPDPEVVSWMRRSAAIAAITAANDCVLATRNAADFASTGLEIINPWQTESLRPRGGSSRA